MAMAIRSFQGIAPTLGARVYVDPAATVIGDVVLGDDVSIWPGTVVRGDVNFIRIGDRTNVQDGTVIHVTHDGPYGKPGGFATVIGADVTIGHGAIVRRHAFVGAGAVVPPGKEVGSGELWLGNPARCVRRLTDEQIEQLHYSAAHYVRLKDRYLSDAP
jgi:carbonic anhydrase/acetyltransferase-like protein (isoleucine patch superfamily)